MHKAHAMELVHSYRRLYVHKPLAPDALGSNQENVTVSSYKVLLFEGNYLSLKYTRYEYGVGATHGNSVAIAYNYILGPLVSLDFPDIFQDWEGALKALSAYCIKALESEKQVTSPDEWIRQGASPNRENFGCINILKGGLLITFQEYQVGPYSEGARVVFVPDNIFMEFVNPKLGLKDLFSTL